MTTALMNLQRATLYGESELGEVAVLNQSVGTYAITKALNGAVVLAAGTSQAAATARVAAIHPGITKIVG